MFKFHLSHGDTITLGGVDQADAINRLRELLGKDAVFVTDKDMQQRRHIEREKAIALAAEAEAQKYRLEAA